MLRNILFLIFLYFSLAYTFSPLYYKLNSCRRLKNVIAKSYMSLEYSNNNIVSSSYSRVEPSKSSQAEIINDEQTWEVDLLYDSDCPICMMEVEFLSKRDINHKIRFTDLNSPDYNPAEHGNVQFSAGMRKIRAVIRSDNTVVTGVEVFRKTYEAIGLGWVFQLTKLPGIGALADTVYDLWAENRLRITGRGELADMLRERSKKLKNMTPVDSCDETCGIDYDD